MNRRQIFGAATALFSAGWLVPLWLGVDAYLSFQRAEVWPLLMGGHPMNSFPFLHFASNCFLVSFAWLGIALAFWSYVGYIVLGRNSAA